MLKKLILCWGLLLCTFLGFSQEFPEKSATLVTDYTNTLSADNKQALENKLVAFNDSTSTQIAVVIMKSVGQNDINQYAALLGRKWGIGTKGKDNGIIVLVALNDHKVSIQTGYGAEGAVPDGVTHDIIYDDILPRFKQNDYYGGLDAATDQLIRYMKGEYKASPTAKKSNAKSQNDDSGAPIGFIIVIVIFVLIAVFRGRGGGGGGHIIGGRGGASPFWWFLAGSALGRSSGGGGWGGFSGGGGSSGGGGGFGGFGGGSFGGGGSSGSW